MDTRQSKPTGRATLRPARSADLPVVESLLRVSGLPTAGVAAALPHFVVAEDERQRGRIVGVIGLEIAGRSGLLRSAAVAEESRGGGIGRQLVERLIADAAALRLDELYLLTTTAAGYFPAFGFRPTTRDAVPAALRETVEFTGACPASAVVMVRPMANAGDR